LANSSEDLQRIARNSPVWNRVFEARSA